MRREGIEEMRGPLPRVPVVPDINMRSRIRAYNYVRERLSELHRRLLRETFTFNRMIPRIPANREQYVLHFFNDTMTSLDDLYRLFVHHNVEELNGEWHGNVIEAIQRRRARIENFHALFRRQSFFDSDDNFMTVLYSCLTGYLDIGERPIVPEAHREANRIVLIAEILENLVPIPPREEGRVLQLNEDQTRFVRHVIGFAFSELVRGRSTQREHRTQCWLNLIYEAIVYLKLRHPTIRINGDDFIFRLYEGMFKASYFGVFLNQQLPRLTGRVQRIGTLLGGRMQHSRDRVELFTTRLARETPPIIIHRLFDDGQRRQIINQKDVWRRQIDMDHVGQMIHLGHPYFPVRERDDDFFEQAPQPAAPEPAAPDEAPVLVPQALRLMQQAEQRFIDAEARGERNDQIIDDYWGSFEECLCSFAPLRNMRENPRIKIRILRSFLNRLNNLQNHIRPAFDEGALIDVANRIARLNAIDPLPQDIRENRRRLIDFFVRELVNILNPANIQDENIVNDLFCLVPDVDCNDAFYNGIRRSLVSFPRLVEPASMAFSSFFIQRARPIAGNPDERRQLVVAALRWLHWSFYARGRDEIQRDIIARNSAEVWNEYAGGHELEDAQQNRLFLMAKLHTFLENPPWQIHVNNRISRSILNYCHEIMTNIGPINPEERISIVNLWISLARRLRNTLPLRDQHEREITPDQRRQHLKIESCYSQLVKLDYRERNDEIARNIEALLRARALGCFGYFRSRILNLKLTLMGSYFNRAEGRKKSVLRLSINSLDLLVFVGKKVSNSISVINRILRDLRDIINSPIVIFIYSMLTLFFLSIVHLVIPYYFPFKGFLGRTDELAPTASSDFAHSMEQYLKLAKEHVSNFTREFFPSQ